MISKVCRYLSVELYIIWEAEIGISYAVIYNYFYSFSVELFVYDWLADSIMIGCVWLFPWDMLAEQG